MSIYNSFAYINDDLSSVVLPTTAIDKLLGDHVALALYVNLLKLHRQQRTADRTVTAHINVMLETIHVSRSVFRDARQKLSTLGLVDSQPTDKKGMWVFSILHPATGESLPTRPSKNVDFANVSDWVALEFYRQCMPDNEVVRGGFVCPFCTSPGAQFSVTLDRGTDKHGSWHCRKCRNKANGGGFVAFLQRRFKIERGTAIGRANALLNTLIEEEEEKQGLPEPEPPSFKEWLWETDTEFTLSEH